MNTYSIIVFLSKLMGVTAIAFIAFILYYIVLLPIYHIIKNWLNRPK